jgi:hypothetical protein
VDLVAVDLVEVARLVRRLDEVEQPGGVAVERLHRRLRLAAHGRRDEDQPGDPVRRLQRRVERDGSAHGVADEPHGLVPGEAEQVVDVAVRRVGRGRLAEAAAIVGEHVRAELMQRRSDVAPGPAVRDAGVEQDDPGAVRPEVVVCEISGHGP